MAIFNRLVQPNLTTVYTRARARAHTHTHTHTHTHIHTHHTRARAHIDLYQGHMTCKCLSATSTQCTLGNANTKHDETNSQV